MPVGHPLAALAATWRGAGEGEYPTIVDFAYNEELVIVPVPDRPLAHWRSTTRDVSTGEPRHAESGFLRVTTLGLELVVAHGFGIVEAAWGSFDGGVLALRSSGLLGIVSAKHVDEAERRYEFDGDSLRYTIAMAAVGISLTPPARRTPTELTTTCRQRVPVPATRSRQDRRASTELSIGRAPLWRPRRPRVRDTQRSPGRRMRGTPTPRLRGRRQGVGGVAVPGPPSGFRGFRSPITLPLPPRRRARQRERVCNRKPATAPPAPPPRGEAHTTPRPNSATTRRLART